MMSHSEPQPNEHPQRMAIPRSRRLVIDLMWLRDQVPTVAHDRVCCLREIANARELARIRISWPILFAKAYALVAQKYPPLRRVFMNWPWAHLYQHPTSVANVVTHRDVDGEPWLFWSLLPAPERTSLADLQNRMNQYQTGDVEQAFRMIRQISLLPGVLRRLAWRCILHLSGQRRVRRCGTFCLTTIGSHGAEIQHPPGFLTGNLTFGPIDDHGRCRVTLAYDHRLLDGRMVANILADLETTLNNTLAEELKTFAPATDASSQAA